jgi:radical SAM-linked protein
MAQVYPYSLAYAKTGDAVYFSHLDTLRILERALRRTGLPVCFTQGCNPHLRLSFYSAVPVGVETEEEWFTLKLEEERAPEEILDRLNLELPDGFTIRRAVPGKYRPALRDSLRLALYYSGDRDRAEDTVSGWFDLDKIEVKGMTKKKAYLCDLRPFFASYEMESDRILLNFNILEGKPPRVGDLARAFRKLESQSPIRITSIRIIKDDPSTEPKEGNLQE